MILHCDNKKQHAPKPGEHVCKREDCPGERGWESGYGLAVLPLVRLADAQSEIERLRGLLRESAAKFDAYHREGFTKAPVHLMQRIDDALKAG